MKKNTAVSIIILSFLLIMAGCSSQDKSPPAQWIQAHTSGEISSTSGFSIVFTSPLGTEGEELPLNPIRLSPDVAGKTIWTTTQTLTFIPDKTLENGKTYRAAFRTELFARALSKQKKDFQGLSDFDFQAEVIKQDLVVYPGSFFIPDPARPEIMEYLGTVTFSDAIESEKAEEFFLVDFGAEELNVKLTESPGNREFELRIPGIRRTAVDRPLTLKLSGPARDPESQKKVSLAVPGTESFRLLSAKPVVKGDKYIELIFSSPIRESQDLRGLVSVKNTKDIHPVSRSNRVRIYSDTEWAENLELIVDSGIMDTENRVLANGENVTVSFPQEKPQVRFLGDGVVLPTSQGTTVPIETMNLNAIMVEAVKIHGQNIPQFLQVNNLDQSDELVRVGETVWRKVIDLDWTPKNRNTWVRYGLDLSPLLENYPDGFFHLKITFRKPHIEYDCDDESAFEDSGNTEDLFADFGGEPEETESSFWDNFQPNNSWEYRRHRHDPCHPAYYQPWYDHNIEISRNILVSNIGIIAEGDEDGHYIVSLTDLRDTKALGGASVKLYNYQNRLLAEDRTARNGKAEFILDEAPFFIRAESGDDYGYLKLNNRAVRTVSHFDTGGVESVDGVEGYIYGERGVWRPGDRIYLNFILQDNEKIIPEDHPVLFKFFDPMGREVDRAVKTENTGGVYSFYTETDMKAVTGDYRAVIRVGGRTYDKIIKVATIMPNRLKVDLTLGDEEIGLTNGEFTGRLESSWLHGAPASGLKADITVSFGSSLTRFTGWDEYSFDDPAREIRAGKQTLFSGNLDSQGAAELSGSFHAEEAPGRLNAVVTTRIFEPGGAFSTEQAAYPFHPYDRYVGVKIPKGDAARGMLLTDEDQKVDLTLLDVYGNRIESGRIKIEVFKLNWRWWWETEEENLVSYVDKSTLTPVASGETEIKDGNADWSFQIHYPDWGRYLIRATDIEGGHSSGQITYIDWPGWAGRAMDEGAGGAAMLALTTDRTNYTAGEEIVISLPSSVEGRGLLTLEKGGRIIESRWFDGKAENTLLKIKATAEMAPNIYAHVTYLQPHLQTLNDLPLRTYGVIPVKVENPETRLTPVITTPASFRPENKARITIRESEGKPMTYTLAMVDEGLLGITRFRTGDPWNHFYRKEASFLKTWDIYDYVAGAYSGVLNTLLAVGGGGGGEDPDGGRKTNRFAPVVEVLPPVHLEAGGVHTHELNMPLYVGAVRLMTVAVHDGAYGRTEKEVPVKTEIMVLGTAPRVLSIGETMELPVSVFALDERIEKAEVRISVEGELKIEGHSVKEVTFDQPGESETSFRLEAGTEPGDCLIRIKAKGAGFQAEHEIPVTVRVPSSPVTEVESLEIPSGGVWTGGINLPGAPGTNSINLEASRIPPLNLTKRMDYLLGFPHGCIEQTTSKAFPQLYLEDLVTMTEEQRVHRQDNIESAIDALKGFQTYSGGLSYWPGQAEPSSWGTTYAGHFLLEAERRGYSLPAGLKEKWIEYQTSASNTWDSGTREGERAQAYRLYSLALAGEPDLPAMNRLKERDGMDTAAAWRLAMAYNLAGYKREAYSLVNRTSLNVEEYRETGGTYGSSFRDRAMILETLVLLNRKSEAVRLAAEISETLSGSDRLSTQETARALLAMSRYAGTMSGRKEMSIEYSWSGGNPETLSTNKPLARAELDPDKAEWGQLTIRNTGSATVFAEIITAGRPAPGDEKAAGEGMGIAVSYLRSDGTPADTDKLLQGEDMEILVTIENRSFEDLEEIAVSHLLPSGWEILNDRLGSGSADSTEYQDIEYQDIRDDRIYTYLDLPRGEKARLKVLVNNSYSGRFYMPMITAGPMYEPDIQAVVPGRWITIGNIE